MTKDEINELFADTYRRQKEYEALRDRVLPPAHDWADEVELLDNTGFIASYNFLINCRLDDKYERYKIIRRTQERNIEKIVNYGLSCPDDLKPILKQHKIKLYQLGEKLGYNSAGNFSRKMQRGFTPAQWRAVQNAVIELIEGRETNETSERSRKARK